MRITLAAIGKAKRSPETELTQQYFDRLPWKVTVVECELKREINVAQRKEREWELLNEATQQCARRLVLDERGKTLSSRELANQLGQWQLQGDSDLGVIIGGADGLSPLARDTADLVLSFGRMSWPHMLVRPMLAEQLYRSWSILEGHPYHRE